MGLLENMAATKAAMALAIRNAMETLFPLPEGMSNDDQALIVANWENLGAATAELLEPTMQHIIDQGGTGGGGGASIVPLATQVIAPAGIVYSCGASSPPEYAECTWRSLLYKTGNGTAYAQLWDLTSSSQISIVSSTAQSPQLKDATVAIAEGHLCEVRVWTTGTAQTDSAILGSSQLVTE